MYAWNGGDQAKVMVLSSSELICLKDSLLLLEGENVKLPSPKNQFSTDVCINTDIPVLPPAKQR